MTLVAFLAPFLTVAQSADRSIVINAGVSGNNTEDILSRIDKDCLSLSPDLTILMIGTNDMLNENKSIPIEQYKENLNRIINLIQSAKSQVLLMNILPVYQPYLLSRHPKEFYKPAGVLEKIRKANNIISEVAREQHIHFLDMHHIFDKVGNIGLAENSLIQNMVNSGRTDGVHPTSDGYRLMAVALYMMIRNKGIPHKKVVCFGDSITFGFGSKINYPDYLRALFQDKNEQSFN